MAATNPIYIDYVGETTSRKFHLPLSVLKKPTNQDEYDKLERLLDQVLDEVRDDENHPLAIVSQIIGDNLEDFDDSSYPPIGQNVTDIDLVRYLMSENNLSQQNIADIFGNQGNVSKFLNGERKLSKSQIDKLVSRFKISADFFFK
jgi:HTH-type transcriptional regulator/antitoxin HigA